MIGKQFFPSSSLRSIFPCVRLPLGNRLKRRKPLKIQASRLRSATERRAKKGARRDSKSVGGDTVWVRVPPPAPGPEPSLVERLRSFSFPRLQAMGQNPVTIRYNSRHNMNLGSLAKETVDIRIGDRVFLAMEVVENGYHTYHVITNFASFAMLIPFYIELWDYFRAKKRSHHMQERKAKRREWLDAHPEEKGAPPSARRKKDR